MSRLLAIIVLVQCAFLNGCASGPPTQAEFAKADYGSSISQQDAQSKAEAFMRGILKDPMSAQYEWGSVERGWARDAPFSGGTLYWGYKLDARINARNSFGGYGGAKQYMFMFHDGDLIGVWGEQEMQGRYGSNSYMGRIK